MCDNTGNEVKNKVQDVYGGIAKSKTTGCSCNRVCESLNDKPIEEYSEKLGYSASEVKDVPDNANMGLGCGT